MHFITVGIVRAFTFHCNIGLRQRANMSPTLSVMYLNYLEQFFQDRNVAGLETRRNYIQYTVYVKLLVLFYKYNTVLLADNNEKIKRNWLLFKDTVMNAYSNTRVIFCKRKPAILLTLYLTCEPLDIVDS